MGAIKARAGQSPLRNEFPIVGWLPNSVRGELLFRITRIVRLRAWIVAVSGLLGSCNSSTVDLLGHTTGDPGDAVARVLALPYALLIDGLTLGNGKSLLSSTSSRSKVDKRPSIDPGPEADLSDMAKQIVTTGRVTVVQAELEQFVGLAYGGGRAQCNERAVCISTSRQRCKTMESWKNMPEGLANNFKEALDIAGAQNTRITDTGPNEIVQLWTVYTGYRAIARMRISCEDNDRLHFQFWYEVPVSYLL